MSTKFEQLLDYLINEDHEKANELFHEIVVEKSREIYESLIAEEEDEDDEEEMDESREEDDEEMDESREEDDEEMDENFMQDDESMYEIGGDASDDMLGDVEDDSAMGGMDDLGDAEGGEEPATKDDLAAAIDELKAEFQALMGDEEGEEAGEEDDDEMDFGDEDSEEADEEEAGEEADDEAFEAFVREYREVVGKPYSGGKVAGKTEDGSVNKSSVVSSGKGKPTTGADAGNIGQGDVGEDKKAGAGGLAGNVKGEFTKGVEKNIAGSSKAGMKDGAALDKKGQAYGAGGAGKTEIGGTNTKSIVDKKL